MFAHGLRRGKSLVVLLLIACLCFCAMACLRQERAVSERQEQTAAQGSGTPSTQMGHAPPSANVKIYRGEIGGRQIEMRLSRDGERVSGTYFYDAIAQNLILDGRINAQGKLTLEEFDASGKQTGKFMCRYEKPEVSNVDVTCDWTKPDGSNQAYVNLNEQQINFTSPWRIAPKVITDRKYNVSASYPQVIPSSGSLPSTVENFNHKVAGIVNDSVKEFTQDEPAPSRESYSANYNVLLATDDFVSVEIQDYYSGGAHPSVGYRAVNYDLRADRELQLADLFKPNSAYEEAIRQYCLEAINRRAEELDKEERKREGRAKQAQSAPIVSAEAISEISAWAMTPKGLMIYFDFPHVIAVFDRIFVPYRVVKDLLKPGGVTAFART